MSTTIREHDYIGLSETPPSMEKKKISEEKIMASSSSSTSSMEEDKTKSAAATCLNMKETELRLGLPGSQSPDRSSTKPVTVSLFGKDNKISNGFVKNPVVMSGAKRVFSDVAINGENENWVWTMNGKPKVDSSKVGVLSSVTKDVLPQSPKPVQNTAPAEKTQVVGWPPIRSYRKNTMASNLAKSNDEEEGDDEKSGGSCCLYVKVGMDGAPYLRKVDLKTYHNYLEFSTALEKMFSCFTIGQCGAHGLPGRDGLNLNDDSKLMDLLHGSEFVLTYEDKDGDWMLVGDVPWKMFTDTCKRLRIMKGSEAIGLAPKCKNRN
jgi:auxin-responsive protein IAA